VTTTAKKSETITMSSTSKNNNATPIKQIRLKYKKQTEPWHSYESPYNEFSSNQDAYATQYISGTVNQFKKL